MELQGLKSRWDKMRIFVGHGPGRAGIFDFSRDIEPV